MTKVSAAACISLAPDAFGKNAMSAINAMSEWFYSLPDLALLLLLGVTVAVLMVLLPRLMARVSWLKPSEDRTDFVLRMQGTLFTMTSLVLAFTLVEADRNFRGVEGIVTNEASQLNRLDRLLFRYDEQQAIAIRPRLLTYATSIVSDEWPAMLENSGSDLTRRAYGELARNVLALDPRNARETQIFSEMLRSLDSLAESRDARLAAIEEGLPWAYWFVVLFAVAVLLFVSSTVRPTAFRSMIMAAQLSVLGVFIGFVIIMDQPFKGDSVVNAAAIEKTIKVIKARGAS
jgi:hypothetical protein